MNICVGVWCDGLLMLLNVLGKKFGIVGFGKIGEKCVCCVVGFDIEIGYYNWLEKFVLYCYFDWVDVFV